MRQAIEAAGFRVESAELSMVPKVTVEIADESTAKKVVRLVEGLEDNDDVQDVYANFDIPEACSRRSRRSAAVASSRAHGSSPRQDRTGTARVVPRDRDPVPFAVKVSRHRPRDGCVRRTGSSTKATGGSGHSRQGAGRQAPASGRSPGCGRSSTGSARSSRSTRRTPSRSRSRIVGADARIALSVGQARGAAHGRRRHRGRRVHRIRAGPGQAVRLRARPRRQGSGAADGEDAALARRGCRRPRTRPTRSRSRSATR